MPTARLELHETDKSRRRRPGRHPPLRQTGYPYWKTAAVFPVCIDAQASAVQLFNLRFGIPDLPMPVLKHRMSHVRRPYATGGADPFRSDQLKEQEGEATSSS
jgi:hypothetical protein